MLTVYIYIFFNVNLIKFLSQFFYSLKKLKMLTYEECSYIVMALDKNSTYSHEAPVSFFLIFNFWKWVFLLFFHRKYHMWIAFLKCKRMIVKSIQQNFSSIMRSSNISFIGFHTLILISWQRYKIALLTTPCVTQLRFLIEVSNFKNMKLLKIIVLCLL